MESTTSQDKTKLHQPHTNQAHLLTPESPLLDSFSQSVSIRHQQPQASVPSPPASPQFNDQFQKDYDQQLYPESGSNNDTTLPPLFQGDGNSIWASHQRTPPTESAPRALSTATPLSPTISPVVDNVERFRPAEPATTQRNTPPKRFVNPVGPVALYNHYGDEYYRYMLAQMEGHRAQMRSRTLPEPKAHHGERDTYDKSVLRSLGSSRVEKHRTTITRSAPKPRTVRPTSSRGAPLPKSPVIVHNVLPMPSKRDRTPVRPRSSRQTTTPDAVGGAASKRTRAAPTKKLDGKVPSQWAELEDFCPPISSLDTPGVELSVVWNNASALNLDNDPDRVHLHPQELKIASKLRLHCNEYLLNKRRIFAAKVRSLQDPAAFNKTSAQNATSVDVNKASRLWSAFDGAGWFAHSWFDEWVES